MPGPTTESLATDFQDIERELKSDRVVFALFREESAGFRGRVETKLAIIQWLGAFFLGTLMSMVGCAIWFTWHAAALTQRVEGLEAVVIKINDRLDKTNDRLDKTNDRLDKIEQLVVKIEQSMLRSNDRLDRIEQTNQRLEKAIESLKPKPPTP